MSSNPFLGMSFFEVVARLQTDKAFSNRFENLAQAIVRGINAPEWEPFLQVFARDANELAQLMAEKRILRDVLAKDRLGTVDTGIFTTGTVTCAAAVLRDAGLAPPEAVQDEAKDTSGEADEAAPPSR